MAIDNAFPSEYQIQHLADAPDNTLDMTTTPVVVTQTVTSTKAKLPASSKAGRRVVLVTNLDEIRLIRIGGTSITAKIGFVVQPRQTVKVLFNPDAGEDLWAVAVGAEVKVEVVEQ